MSSGGGHCDGRSIVQIIPTESVYGCVFVCLCVCVCVIECDDL